MRALVLRPLCRSSFCLLAYHHRPVRRLLVVRSTRFSVAVASAYTPSLGVYFLLGPSGDPDCYRAYVGEVGKRTLLPADQGARGREAVVEPGVAHRQRVGGVQLRGDRVAGSRLYDVLNNAVAPEVMNIRCDSPERRSPDRAACGNLSSRADGISSNARRGSGTFDCTRESAVWCWRA